MPYPYAARYARSSLPRPAALQANGLSPPTLLMPSTRKSDYPQRHRQVGPLEYQVEMNSSPQTIAELNDLPVKT